MQSYIPTYSRLRKREPLVALGSHKGILKVLSSLPYLKRCVTRHSRSYPKIYHPPPQPLAFCFLFFVCLFCFVCFWGFSLSTPPPPTVDTTPVKSTLSPIKQTRHREGLLEFRCKTLSCGTVRNHFIYNDFLLH